MPLTVCPLSNVRLRVSPSVEEHPVKRMLEEGLRVTVNSDDPAYFGGYVADNYAFVRDGLGFTREDFRAVAENSFLASFLGEGEKRRLLEPFPKRLHPLRTEASGYRFQIRGATRRIEVRLVYSREAHPFRETP